MNYENKIISLSNLSKKQFQEVSTRLFNQLRKSENFGYIKVKYINVKALNIYYNRAKKEKEALLNKGYELLNSRDIDELQNDEEFEIDKLSWDQKVFLTKEFFFVSLLRGIFIGTYSHN